MRLQVLSLIGVLSVLSAVAPADVRKEMEAQEKAFEKALLTKDMGWFEKVAAKDYKEVSTTGKITSRAESIKMMKEMMTSGEVKSVTGKITKISTKGKTTLVTVDTHFVMVMKIPGAPKASKLESWLTYEETWTKDGGKWQIHQLKSLKERATMDGKPMPAGAMGG